MCVSQNLPAKNSNIGSGAVAESKMKMGFESESKRFWSATLIYISLPTLMSKKVDPDLRCLPYAECSYHFVGSVPFSTSSADNTPKINGVCLRIWAKNFAVNVFSTLFSISPCGEQMCDTSLVESEKQFPFTDFRKSLCLSCENILKK